MNGQDSGDVRGNATIQQRVGSRCFESAARVSPPFRLRSQDLEWRVVDDEVVILDLREQRFLSLNHSGALLWKGIAAGASHQELADQLVSTYGIEPSQAAADVAELTASLAAESLLLRDDENP